MSSGVVIQNFHKYKQFVKELTMPNDYGLLIITPMQEEHDIVQEILADLGYADVSELKKKKIFSMHVSGMGAINTMNFIYNVPHIFENTTVDVLLIGFAGALSENLHIGDSCQVGTVSDFSHIACQEAGDFEIIPTPSTFFDENIVLDAEKPRLPHLRLQTSGFIQEKTYQLISVPGLLQGEKTKQYLCEQGIELVDMEGFSLAGALQHIQHGSAPVRKINLDILRVVTDSPSEKFLFSKLDAYKDYLRQSTLIRQALKNKLSKIMGEAICKPKS